MINSSMHDLRSDAARWLLAVILFALALAKCSAGSSEASRSAQNSPPTGWTSHRDPLGFSVNLPKGWSVAADKNTGRINLSGPPDEQVLIWPAWAPQGLDVSTAQVIVKQFAARIGKDVNVANGWTAPEQAAETAVRAIGRSGGRAAIATLVWISTARGAASFFYVTAGPETAYRQDQDKFSRILQSFRVTGSRSAAQSGSQRPPADAGIHYVNWTDPREGAFSMQVPEGWSVEGGLIRRNALDPRAVVRIKSPDGAITLASGDGELPGFVLPNPQWAAVFPEGSWYSPGANIQWQVRRFTPALPFGEEYLRMRLPGICSDYAVKDRRERPDLVQEMQNEAAGFQIGRVTNSAGEIAFTCDQNGQPREGDLLVSTQLVQSGVLQIWYAKNLLAYLAPHDRVPEAQAVMAYIVKSVQVNPQWVARQQQTTMQASQIATQTQEHLSNTIMSTYWNKVSADDERMRRVENSILGTVDVVDPETGERRRIDNNANYDWINNKGVIVGTQTDSAPNVDFRPLTRLP